MRYGLIGCGMMGQEHMRNIALLDGATIPVIFDPDPKMRREAAILAPDARFVETLPDLLAQPDIDALVIASPNHLHLAQLEEIARQRPLPVLVEKPVYTDPASAARVADLASTYPALLWVAMEYRYMPPIAEFLKRLPEATGGLKMLTLREHRFPFLSKVGNWNRFNAQTGGTLVEKCCHFFDLMCLAFEARPVRVMASASQAVNHKDEVHDGKQPDIWDNAYVIVDFEGGGRAMLDLCMFAEGSRYQEELSAVGPSGKIEAFVPGPGRFWPDHLGPAPVPKVVVSPRDPSGPQEVPVPVDPNLLAAGDHNGSTFYQHQLFAQAVTEGRPPQVSLADGALAVQIGLAAQQSAQEGRVITL